MEVSNGLALSSPAEFLSQLGDEESFVMVNFLKFKKNADYESVDMPPCSGEAAFHKYLDMLKEPFEKKGMRIIKYSKLFGVLIGSVEELWDYILIVGYPSKSVFNQLLASKVFAEAQMHRLAGLEGQLNIGTRVASEIGCIPIL